MAAEFAELQPAEEPDSPRSGATIWRDVAEELAYAASCRPDDYQAALLIGRPSTGDRAGSDITAYAELARYDGPLAFQRELLREWDAVQARISRRFPDREVLGWVSARPRGRGRLDAIEQIIHRTFFNVPHAVALCLDPARHVWGLYGADADGWLVNIDFDLACVADRDAPTTSTETQ